MNSNPESSKSKNAKVNTLAPVSYTPPRPHKPTEPAVEAAKKLRDDAVAGHHLFQQTVITQLRSQQQSTIQPSGLVAAAVASTPLHEMDGMRPTCSSPTLNALDGKRRVVIGTEDGVYVGMEDDPSSFRIAIKDVSAIQVSVLEEYHILMVLSGKILKAYDIRCLEPDADKVFQNGRQLGKNVQYYTAGVCAGKTLVITKRRMSENKSHFTAYEPIKNAVLDSQHHKGSSLSLLKSSVLEWFKMYREFYVGSESSRLLMFSKMVCVVCPKGFEVLMLENLIETRVYPSRQDPEYAFLLKRPESVPVSMFKLNSDEFLMCYSDFAFTMTNKGTLAKKELIEWEGRPESFAMAYPYIIAFESRLIEVRHIETGALEQRILGNDIRLLHSEGDQYCNAMILVHKDLQADAELGELRQVVRLSIAPPQKTSQENIIYRAKSAHVTQSKPTSQALSFHLGHARTSVMPTSPLYANSVEHSLPTEPLARTKTPALPAPPIHPHSISYALPSDLMAPVETPTDPPSPSYQEVVMYDQSLQPMTLSRTSTLPHSPVYSHSVIYDQPSEPVNTRRSPTVPSSSSSSSPPSVSYDQTFDVKHCLSNGLEIREKGDAQPQHTHNTRKPSEWQLSGKRSLVWTDTTQDLQLPQNKTQSIAVYRDCSQNYYVILWDDVLDICKDAQYLLRDDIIVPFIVDDNFEYVTPLRFTYVQGVVMDVVTELSVVADEAAEKSVAADEAAEKSVAADEAAATVDSFLYHPRKNHSNLSSSNSFAAKDAAAKIGPFNKPLPLAFQEASNSDDSDDDADVDWDTQSLMCESPTLTDPTKLAIDGLMATSVDDNDTL
ncbi:hypothetical protein EC968_008923 [Mortierella alpina]|nr:hypothetical protein EC968_008923 [Mortierella alpina]